MLTLLTTFALLLLVGSADAAITLTIAPGTPIADVTSAQTGFTIERATGLDSIVFAPIAATTAKTYVDTAVIAGITYRYRVIATNSAGISAPSNVVTVTAPTPPPPGAVFTDAFDRPNGLLENEWSVLAGSWSLVSQGAVNGPTGGFHAAVRQDRIGMDTQMASASFTSVDNNLSPQFGLYVRYQGPRDYTACYRQTGGSSQLRIVTVTGGVETIRKQINVPNPARLVAFTLRCAVTGTTVTMTWGIVTLTAQIPVLDGFPGFYVKTGASSKAQHKVDNFVTQ